MLNELGELVRSGRRLAAGEKVHVRNGDVHSIVSGEVSVRLDAPGGSGA